MTGFYMKGNTGMKWVKLPGDYKKFILRWVFDKERLQLEMCDFRKKKSCWLLKCAANFQKCSYQILVSNIPFLLPHSKEVGGGGDNNHILIKNREL